MKFKGYFWQILLKKELLAGKYFDLWMISLGPIHLVQVQEKDYKGPGPSLHVFIWDAVKLTKMTKLSLQSRRIHG